MTCTSYPSAAKNRQIHLVSRPSGMPVLSNFKLHDASLPCLADGEVLIRNLFLSVDPYMRGRLGGRPSSHPPFELNRPVVSDAVGRIIESKSFKFKTGDFVTGRFEWSDYFIAKEDFLQKVDQEIAPITTALGALGMPGMTAYFGMLDIGQPKTGETVVVSAAAGAVGMTAGQIAKIKGCRVVGLTGSDEKKAFLVKELGFHAAVNYKSTYFVQELKDACSAGVDVYFDNVGGDITDEVVKLINKRARIALSGQISMYNLEKPDIGPRNFRMLIVKSAMAKGLIVFDYTERFPEAMDQMRKWVLQGQIKCHETIVQGLENAPKAFLGLFSGDNIGKQLVAIEQ